MGRQPKMKVLIITVRADFGGGPEHIFKLTKHLLKDFDFYFAAPDDYPYYQRYSDLVGKNNLIKIPHRKFKIKALIDLRKFIFINKINIIHSHGKGAGIYSRILRMLTTRKIVHTFHGLHIGEYKGTLRFLYLLIERFLAYFTDVFINVSQSEKKLLSKHIVSQKAKLRVIHNGIEIPLRTVIPDVFDQSPRIVLTFSRFDYSKHTEMIIEIMMHLKNLNRIEKFSFIILGSGPDEEKIKKLVQANNLNDYITFPGSVLDTKEFILNSFCYLSTSRWEGMPLGVLEAFSVGLPVIASNVVGNRDVINHDVNGFLYDAKNPADAAERICALADNKEKWLLFSQNARSEAISKYDVNRMAEETKLLYSEILREDKLI
ncbi:MAG: glycosyltransferase [Ignavibacteriaceae bacterium]